MVEAANAPETPPAGTGHPTFRIALSMSGAISAGAYTAGVFDFLMQALAELEQAPHRARRDGEPKLPDHDVRIVAMTGASAGGVTAALGAVALGYGLAFQPDPASPSGRKPGSVPTSDNGTIDSTLPRLYDAWVVRPRMVGVGPADPCLLSTEDLAEGKVAALLNWRVLDAIRDAALARPASLGQTGPYAWFTAPLHVYLTLTNLIGVPYSVKGANDSAAYRMVTHADRLHFKIAGLGTDASVASDWAGLDKGTPLTVADLQHGPAVPPDWQLLGDGALATAAFPGGLTARVLRATRDDYADRWFPAPRFPGSDISPAWPDATPTTPSLFGYVNSDGGVINNDPFEYARYCLLDNWQSAAALNPPAPGDADRAVIMIAPFPEGATIEAPPNLDTALLRVAKALVPALIQQARFKIGELAAAADPTYASRWLIAPRRTDPEGPPSAENIACGLLGGFGGFLEQRFREHDFQLGRRNCQQFLRQWKESAFTKEQEPVIPLFGSAAHNCPFPQWPHMSQAAFETLLYRIKLRADALVALLLKQDVKSHFMRWLVGRGWWWYKDTALQTVRSIILAELIRRDQIEDGLQAGDSNALGRFSPDERAVIAAMVDERYELRTVPGISASTKLTESIVQQAITAALALPDTALHKVWQSPLKDSKGKPTYTLWSRRLPAYRTSGLIGRANRLVAPVKID